MSAPRRQPLTRVDEPSQPTVGGRVLVRRRRPSGYGRSAPPLLGRPARVWSVLVAAAVLSLLLGGAGLLRPSWRSTGRSPMPSPAAGTRWADTLSEAVEALGTTAVRRIVWIPTVLVLIWFARWRHLGVYLTTLSVVAVVSQGLFGDASLPREVRSTLTGSSQGYVLPSWPVTVFATVATATAYMLLPRGRIRRLAFSGVAALVLGLVLARVHLGFDDLYGDLASAVVGAGAAVIAATVFAPEADFPVVYRRQNRERCSQPRSTTTWSTTH